jgi:hypothetical protein
MTLASWGLMLGFLLELAILLVLTARPDQEVVPVPVLAWGGLALLAVLVVSMALMDVWPGG